MPTDNNLSGRLKIRYRDNDGKVQEVTRLPDPTPKEGKVLSARTRAGDDLAHGPAEAPKRGRPAKK